jgi:hypothetical protein
MFLINQMKEQELLKIQIQINLWQYASIQNNCKNTKYKKIKVQGDSLLTQLENKFLITQQNILVYPFSSSNTACSHKPTQFTFPHVHITWNSLYTALKSMALEIPHKLITQLTNSSLLLSS